MNGNAGLVLLGWVGWLAVALLAIFFFQPRSLFSMATSILPGVLYFTETDQKLIALTIDDGPDARTTPQILDILQRYGAQATFFVISSRVQGNEALVAEMVRRGHELGNHLTEDRPSIYLSPQAFEADLLAADRVIAPLAPFTQVGSLRWLRPASGWYNAAMIRTATKYDYRVALGSIFPFDTHIASVGFCALHIRLNAAPGSIIVLHDSGAWGDRTAVTLERVLPQLINKGYRIVSLSELVRFS